MKISILRAMQRDVREIATLEELCFASPWPEEMIYRDIVENENVYYVLRLDGEAIGYGGMWIIVDEAHITNVCVQPQYRRRGYARLLMEKMKRAAIRMGAVCMTLEVRVSNTAALALYDSMGFEIAGRRKRYYTDNQEDAYIMWNENLLRQG